MQIVGNVCHKCKSTIASVFDGSGCPWCEIFAHNACNDEDASCPGCQRRLHDGQQLLRDDRSALREPTEESTPRPDDRQEPQRRLDSLDENLLRIALSVVAFGQAWALLSGRGFEDVIYGFASMCAFYTIGIAIMRALDTSIASIIGMTAVSYFLVIGKCMSSGRPCVSPLGMGLILGVTISSYYMWSELISRVVCDSDFREQANSSVRRYWQYLFADGFYGLLNKGPVGVLLFGLMLGVATGAYKQCASGRADQTYKECRTACQDKAAKDDFEADFRCHDICK